MKIKVFAYYFAIYVFLSVFTLCYIFIEGDDALTVMYHIMGRNSELQLPYSSYHSMFDSLLSFIDAQNEPLIRGFGIFISFLGGLISLCLIAHIVFLKNGSSHKNSFYGLLLLPFIIPEVLFSSLLINPSLISISFLLISHVYLLKFLKQKNWVHLVLSVLLFGLGTSFRWSCGFYLFILFGEFILAHSKSFKDALSKIVSVKTVLIFLSYISSVIMFVYVSGYTPIDVYNTFSEGSAYMGQQGFSLLSYGAVAITFLTPALLLLLIVGIYFNLKLKLYKNTILFLVGLLPYFVIGLYPSYKYMITIIVPLTLLIISGLKIIRCKLGKVLVFCVMFIPWLIGFQIDSNSAWGPGFELKNSIDSNRGINADFNPDKSININTINFGFKSGMALPTLEGPRPLFGFLYCLSKDWKQLFNDIDLNRNKALNYAIENNLDILQDVPHAYLTTKIIGMEYMTKHQSNRRVGVNKVREFINDRDTVTFFVLKNKLNLFETEKIKRLKLNKSEVVVYSLYTNIIAKLKTKYQEDFEQKSAHWGILLLD